MTTTRTNRECHTRSARSLDTALVALQRALRDQDGLEWSAVIEALIRETERARDGCERYAKQ